MGLTDIDLASAGGTSVRGGAAESGDPQSPLSQGASILLLDEPTATLAPQEADALFALLHTLADEGATVVFVTHKLREVMAHSQAVTVLRAGRSAGHFITVETNAEELLAAA